ncbi:hypothetical protein [Kocuria sp. KH4]
MATAFAAASHVVAGGQVPPLLLVLLSLALSGPVCMALAGRVLSRSLLLAGVLVSQGVFHLIFTVAGSVTTVVDATHHAQVSTPAIGPALVLQAQAPAVHGGPGMLDFHVLAAAVTYGFLRRGEVALVGLLDALRLRVRQLWRVFSAPVVVHRPRPVSQRRPHVLTDQSLLRPVRSYRGPPAACRRNHLLPTGLTLVPTG